MASPSLQLLLCTTILLILTATTTSAARPSARPHGLILPVRKDPSTLQYVTHIFQRTPLVPVNLVVDLGGQFLWVDCENGYVSSTHSPARCGSKQCKLAKSSSCGECYSAPRAGCSNNTCGLYPDNTVALSATDGELTQDVISLNATKNGANLGRAVVEPRFLFTCSPNSLLDKLSKNVQGMAGLGRTRISLPSQLSSAFKLPKKFGLCLTASTSSNGVIFFGAGPYKMLPGMDVSESLSYTPLLKNRVSTASIYSQGDASSDYFIGVQSIKINDRPVSLNKKLLAIGKDGHGGTKISTVNPYTVMESSIYNAVTKVYIQEATKMNITSVAPVAPFGICFSTKNVISTRVGPGVPSIDLVLQTERDIWRIFGGNSMVQVNNDVMCLGILDGGSIPSPRTSIVIGAHQLEDNLLQFDLANSRLGFSSSLLFRRTNCANFDFKTRTINL